MQQRSQYFLFEETLSRKSDKSDSDSPLNN